MNVEVGTVATEVVSALRARGATVATAESLTGGLVVAALTSVPGASEVVRGGICAYHSQVKAEVVGVTADALRHGAVNARVAEELADGARLKLRATFGIGTTGVAGPDPADGCEVGTVYIAIAAGAGAEGGPTERLSRRLSLHGDRAAIRDATVVAVLGMLAEYLAR